MLIIIPSYIYVHIHIGAWTYMSWCVECGCMYFVYEPLIHFPSLSGDGQIKLSCDLKDFNFIVIILGCPGNIQSGNIFMSNLWVAQCLEAENIHPCIYTSVFSGSPSAVSTLRKAARLRDVLRV